MVPSPLTTDLHGGLVHVGVGEGVAQLESRKEVTGKPGSGSSATMVPSF